MTIELWVWVIGIVVFGAVCAYSVGKYQDEDFEPASILTFAILVLAWPVALAGAIIGFPFYLLYRLGEKSRKE